MAKKDDNTLLIVGGGLLAYLLLSRGGGFGLGRPVSVNMRLAIGGTPSPRPGAVMRSISAIETTVTNNTSQQLILRGGRIAIDVRPLKRAGGELSAVLKEDTYYYWFGGQWEQPDVVLPPNQTTTFYVLGGPQHNGNVQAEIALVRALQAPRIYFPQARTFRGLPAAGEFFFADGRSYRFFDRITTVVGDLASDRPFPDRWENAIGGAAERTFIDALFSLIDVFTEQGFPGTEGGPTPGEWEQSGDVVGIPDILNQPGENFPTP